MASSLKCRTKDVLLNKQLPFDSLFLKDKVVSGLNEAGFKIPSPVQLEAVPVGRYGRDLLVQAKSGTGKTLVFVIVGLEILNPKLFCPQVMIVVPTREISVQICSIVNTVGSGFPELLCHSFIGGTPVSVDIERVDTTQIVVGTPGRLKYLIYSMNLPTESIKLVVFDEADKLLYSDFFKNDIEYIFDMTPEKKQVIATSATFHPDVKERVLNFLKDPYIVCLNKEDPALLGIVHYATLVEYSPVLQIMYKNKINVLERILRSIKFAQCLVFCNSVERVKILYNEIKNMGFSSAYISSAEDQHDRLKTIENLKEFKCKVLVTSDLTSRGIDAENVDLVINYDLKYTPEEYLHRIGRAGRYGSVGAAISLVYDTEQRCVSRIEQRCSFKVYKLPDPIPRDLILYPCEAEYFYQEVKYQSNIELSSENESVVSSEEVEESISEKASTQSDVTKTTGDHIIKHTPVSDHSEPVAKSELKSSEVFSERPTLENAKSIINDSACKPTTQDKYVEYWEEYSGESNSSSDSRKEDQKLSTDSKDDSSSDSLSSTSSFEIIDISHRNGRKTNLRSHMHRVRIHSRQPQSHKHPGCCATMQSQSLLHALPPFPVCAPLHALLPFPVCPSLPALPPFPACAPLHVLPPFPVCAPLHQIIDRHSHSHKCCCAKMHCQPLLSTNRSGIRRGKRSRVTDQSTSVPTNHREGVSFDRVQIPDIGRREQSFSNHNVQSYFSGSCSRHCMVKHSSRGISRGKVDRGRRSQRGIQHI